LFRLIGLFGLGHEEASSEEERDRDEKKDPFHKGPDTQESVQKSHRSFVLVIKVRSLLHPHQWEHDVRDFRECWHCRPLFQLHVELEAMPRFHGCSSSLINPQNTPSLIGFNYSYNCNHD